VIQSPRIIDGGKIMADNFTFKRVEKKYLLNEAKYYELLERIEPYMQLDNYGLHTICNVYFDTDNFDLIRTSIEKPAYKEKLRLRSYGVPNEDSKVFLEIKKKFDKVVYKRRIGLTLKEAKEYLAGEKRLPNDGQIEREIDYFVKFYKPVAKMFIAYDRMAYFGRDDSSIRMTFDKNIRSRNDFIELENGDAGKLLLKNNERLLEIKVAGAFPIWLAAILSELEIYPVSFSKYGNIYKNELKKCNNIDLNKAYNYNKKITFRNQVAIV